MCRPSFGSDRLHRQDKSSDTGKGGSNLPVIPYAPALVMLITPACVIKHGGGDVSAVGSGARAAMMTERLTVAV